MFDRVFFILSPRPPPRSSRTDTLFPCPPPFRSVRQPRAGAVAGGIDRHWHQIDLGRSDEARDEFGARGEIDVHRAADLLDAALIEHDDPVGERHRLNLRSEEHTSELQSLMRISYAVFCLKKKNITLLNNKYEETMTTLSQ